MLGTLQVACEITRNLRILQIPLPLSSIPQNPLFTYEQLFSIISIQLDLKFVTNYSCFSRL